MTASITPLLLDTDVVIDYLRNKQEAVDYIDTLTAPLFLSVITVPRQPLENYPSNAA